MKIERDTTLNDAVHTVTTLLEQMKGSRISVGERQVGLDDPVTLELEIDSSGDEFEVEFEIKWRAPQASSSEGGSAGSSEGQGQTEGQSEGGSGEGQSGWQS